MSCAHAFGEWCPECIAGLVADYNRVRAERDRLRAALAGVTGGTDVTRAELEQMELVVRASAVAAEDKASALDAIHALLATAP